MSRPPRVTVGLPVYNGEAYLAAAIDSILEQDYQDLELLIADNGSTDGSLRIAEAAAARDPRVRVHASPENRGAAWNYNRLVSLAQGEYFKWAAHDDVLRPAFLSRCVEVLDSRQDVVLVYTRAVDIDERDEVVHEYDLPAYATSGSPSVRARTVLLRPSPCFESFGLMRTAQLRTTGCIGAYTSSDRTLFLELSMLGLFFEVPEVLFLHRQHPERSVARYSDDRARNVWFDPSWKGRPSAPRWRLLREYVAAVRRSPLPVAQQLRVAGVLPAWVYANRRTLAREAASTLLRRGTTVPATIRTESVNR